jgi:hypothetical protein
MTQVLRKTTLATHEAQARANKVDTKNTRTHIKH